ncbi:hypothetical protein PInf_016492 [Phytophthora infestans]|nr:hypothetical protein PInf_016492 [Phytophthora infestans]
MVGRIARNKQLNDVAMVLALWHVSKYSPICYAVDSISVTDKKIFNPDYKRSSVLVPVHMIALKHWMIQIVEVKMTDTEPSKRKIWATFYDPLGEDSNLEICQAKWTSFTLPLLEAWFKRDKDREKFRNLASNMRVKKHKKKGGYGAMDAALWAKMVEIRKMVKKVFS